MQDEPTNKTDTNGNEPDPSGKETSHTTPLIDIANQAAKRMEEANIETARLYKLQEERDARIALGGTAGGRVEMVVQSEDDLKKNNAKEFFKGTQLENAIEKAHE